MLYSLTLEVAEGDVTKMSLVTLQRGENKKGSEQEGKKGKALRRT